MDATGHQNVVNKRLEAGLTGPPVVNPGIDNSMTLLAGSG